MTDKEKMNVYIAAIHDAITQMFIDPDERDGAELPFFDPADADATLFFTAVPYAVNIALRRITGIRNNHLEITHFLNALVHQHEAKRAVEEALSATDAADRT